jgi:hypothetical protein
MTFDLTKVLNSKRKFRSELATRPITEKLAMLDALRERELAIRQSGGHATGSGALHEEPAPYRITKRDGKPANR